MVNSVAMASDKALFRYQMMWTRVSLFLHILSLYYSSTASSTLVPLSGIMPLRSKRTVSLKLMISYSVLPLKLAIAQSPEIESCLLFGQICIINEPAVITWLM